MSETAVYPVDPIETVCSQDCGPLVVLHIQVDRVVLRMRKHKINLIVDLAFLLLFVALGGTGLVLRYVLPPGSGRGRSLVWGLSRHEWGSVHFWISAVAIALLLIHLALHWAWVWNSSLAALGRAPGSPNRSVRVLGGTVVLVLSLAGLGLFWWAAAGQVQPGDRGGRGAGRHEAVEQAPSETSGGFETPEEPERPRRRRRGRDGQENQHEPAATHQTQGHEGG